MSTSRVAAGFLLIVLIVLSLAMNLSAKVQSAVPSAPEQTPSTAAPAQNAPAAPSQNPTTSQPAAGQAGSGASSPSQAQQQDENPLNLSDEQKAKLRPILLEENQQMDAVRNDSSLTPDQKVVKANQIRQNATPKIRAILTPEQIQKLAELQQKAKQQSPSMPSEPPK